jgi:hypothetical protein
MPPADVLLQTGCIDLPLATLPDEPLSDIDA